MSANTPSLTRRDVLKIFGTAAAFLGIRSVTTKASAAEQPAPVPPGQTAQPFVLPKLAYSYDALEPHIDARTMEIHYTKHHQAYITNANKALADHPDLRSLTGEAILADLGAIPESIRTTLRNNVGGHVNHSFFWRIIGPGGGGAPNGTLADAINRKFRSLEAFQNEFTDAAMKRFGSGWAWLTVKGGDLAVTSTANQDSPISEGAKPILGIDVWEHAYYLKQQNKRADYVTEFWRVVNWPQAAANYAAATS